MVMSFFWAIGACLEALLAWAIMPTLGWRYLVGVSVIPLLIFLFFSPIIPESLLYLSVSGQQKRAEQLIARVKKLLLRKDTFVIALVFTTIEQLTGGRMILQFFLDFWK